MNELEKRGISVEVAGVKAHGTKKEKEKMAQFERFVTEGNEKADELAKAGAMLDEGFMAELRADTVRSNLSKRSGKSLWHLGQKRCRRS